MYENFYGLSGKPFSLLPDAHFLFPSAHHRSVMNLLEYGVAAQSGFVVVTGEIGAGKTTIIRRFLKSTGADITVGLITNPSATLGRLLGWVANAFDLPVREGDDTRLYNAFVDFLLQQYAGGKRVVLVVDEAQNLTVDMLEQLRMLSNVNNENDLMLQIILVGQPELLENLKRPELRQFVQRITVHYHLGALSAAETTDYIHYRLKNVGGKEALFDEAACAAVYYFTGGVPRLINLLCDHALVYGFSADAQRISVETVAEVVMDRSRFGLTAFINVPSTLSMLKINDEVRMILNDMRRASIAAVS